jgi:tetratricopeptide (TPR) repeat protein
VARAETLLAEVRECPEAGWLALQRSGGGGPEELEGAARFALDVARRYKDADLEAVALGQVGMALVLAGRISEGIACLDESMASVSAGEVGDFVAAGTAYCTMLGACEHTLDFRRAEQWCRAAEDFSRRHHGVPLFALCRTFYGDVLIAIGRWAQAEEMLRSALDAFAEIAPAWRRLALARLAKLRARQGRFEEAARLVEGLVLILGHTLHNWTRDENRLLLEKAYAALPDGGALIAYEPIIDDERRENTFGLLMSLNMLIETPGGFDCTGAECQQWLRDAGFRETYIQHLVGPNSMAIAIK